MPAAPVDPRPPGRFVPAYVIALTALVFAAGLVFVTAQLRNRLHEQVLLREGETLSAVAAMQLANSTAEIASLGLAEVPGDLLAAVLKTSRLRGVLAIRVLDEARRTTTAVPWVWTEDPPEATTWERLAAAQPLARLHRRADREELAGVLLAPVQQDDAVPLLEVWVPLRRAETAPLAGAAQFWIDGAGVAAEFARIDRHLTWQAGLVWLAGTALIAIVLGAVFRRLIQARISLQEHRDHLQRANRELLLAAKTTALGAVTAHLIHELKNPIAGLESLVAGAAESTRADVAGASRGGDMSAAGEIAGRLRTTVNEVVALLRDEEQATPFELSGPEIGEVAVGKVRKSAAAKKIDLEVAINGEASIQGRRANLAVLVLQNLLNNAIEAAPAGSAVRLLGGPLPTGGVEFFVEDAGPGLPEAVRRQLFQPCRSAKAGGTGIGLALSQQLAQQAGGRIELVSSDAEGTRFRLVLANEA